MLPAWDSIHLNFPATRTRRGSHFLLQLVPRTNYRRLMRRWYRGIRCRRLGSDQLYQPPPEAQYRNGTYPADPALSPPAGSQGYQTTMQPEDYGPTGARPYYGVPGAIPPGPPASAKQDAIREEAMRLRARMSPGQIGSDNMAQGKR
jgi:hypothetical protein